MTKREIRRLKTAARLLNKEVGDIFKWSDRYGDSDILKDDHDAFRHALSALDHISLRLINQAEEAE